MKDRLQDKVVLITGAGRGVGHANVGKCIEQGASVVATDIDESGGATLTRDFGPKVTFFRQDVSSEEDWRALTDSIQARYGRLDVLVNNAAILQLGDVQEESLAGWRKVFSVNTESVFLGVNHCMALLESSKSGSIINMTSSSALFGLPHFAAYSASKAAVRGLTQSVAVYCNQRAKGVRCNALAPDGIVTPMTMDIAAQAGNRQLADPKRSRPFLCSPEEVADTVVFLASDESRRMNGATITLDAGATITPPYLAS